MTAPRAPADRADLIEVMARAMWDSTHDIATWDNVPPAFFAQKGRCRNVSSAVLAALEARGVRLVPKKATRRMLNDGIDALNAGADAFVGADDAYQAVLAASPYAPEGE